MLAPLLSVLTLATAPSADDVTARLLPLRQTYTHVRHAFAMLGDPAPDDIKLARLDARSYDDTEVAPARTLATPRSVTVVTDQGACIVSTTTETWVRTYPDRKAQLALDLDVSACGTEAAPFAIDGAVDIRADLPRPSVNAFDVDSWLARVTKSGVTGDATTRSLPLTHVSAIDTTLVDHAPRATGHIELLRQDDDTVLATLPDRGVLAELRWGGRDFIIVDYVGLHAITP